MTSAPAYTPLSLFDGVDRNINENLGIKSYAHKSACLELSKQAPSGFDSSKFVSGVFKQLDANWRQIVSTSGRKPSAKNWRWFEPVTNIRSANTSPEVTLERALIRACLDRAQNDWSNQVPIMSGLVDSTSYRRRAIDLVCMRRPSAFDFVELKVGSDTPLFAAMEILLYGLVWVLSQRDWERLGYPDTPLLVSKDVRFCVLAPANYYERYDLSWLERGISTGLGYLGEEYGINLDFLFQAFPRDFIWPHSYPADELCGFLDRLQNIYADAV